jgi:pyruvate dehydrogenase E2 component (dihydrolipoamide acetyltransferase)
VRLAAHNEGRGTADRVVVAAVLNAAIARAVADVPEVNGWWVDGSFRRSDDVDLGVVVSLRTGGIVVPVIATADRLDVDEMMGRMSDLVERARRGRLRPRDVTEASITVTNLGERGPEAVSGVIHPPQVALIGVGGVHEEPIVVDHEIVVAHVAHVTITGDHRAHDAATVVRLLERIKHHLEALP